MAGLTRVVLALVGSLLTLPAQEAAAPADFRRGLAAAETPAAFARILETMAASASPADASAMRSLATMLAGAKEWSEVDLPALERAVQPAGSGAAPATALPAVLALRRAAPADGLASWASVEILLAAKDMIGVKSALESIPGLIPARSDSFLQTVAKAVGLTGVGIDLLQGVAGAWLIATRIGWLREQLAAETCPPPVTEAELRFLAQLQRVHAAMTMGEQMALVEAVREIATGRAGHPLFALWAGETHASVGPAWDPAAATAKLGEFLRNTSKPKLAAAAASEGSWTAAELLYYHGAVTGRKFASIEELRAHAEALRKKVDPAVLAKQALNPDFEELQKLVAKLDSEADQKRGLVGDHEKEMRRVQDRIADLERQLAREKANPSGKGRFSDAVTQISSSIGTERRNLSTWKTRRDLAAGDLAKLDKRLALYRPKLDELTRLRASRPGR